jgi:hypothetical protein
MTMEGSMGTPQYHVGQIVHFTAPEVKLGAPGGTHRIERLLPSDGGEHQYRLKAVDTGRERIVRESQIGGRMVVEALAQSLYEAGNTTNVPWKQRDRTIRDPWLSKALALLADETRNK